MATMLPFKRTDADAGQIAAALRPFCEPLPSTDDAEAFGAVFDRFADARVVLLGEATHGTSEFYRARAAITRRLVERHGFTVVAVEAHWPDAETELASHYFEAVLPEQFDAYVWFEETKAVTPLSGGRPHGAPETYPFGL